MHWIEDYNLYLFDFDGLLVNTEEVHYAAYRKTFEDRGYKMIWTFPEYIKVAHYSSEGLRERSYAEVKGLYSQEPNWRVIYAEKTKNYLEILDSGVSLMPGVEEFLTLLSSSDKTLAVVTHSARPLIEKIRSQHPILQKIEHWITREDYEKPKPESDSYQLAIDRLANPDDKVIGFEDSPRGLTALMGTRAQGVIITELEYPEIEDFLKRGAKHFKTFHSILDKGFEN